jgi:hypothetical protein
MDRYAVFGVATASIFAILVILWGLRRRASPSSSSPSTPSAVGANTVAKFNYVLKDLYEPAIREQLNAASVFGDGFWKVTWEREDWGFDEMWPRSWEQPWFKQWERRERRAAMSPFARGFEDEVDGLSAQMRKDMARQTFTVPMKKMESEDS